MGIPFNPSSNSTATGEFAIRKGGGAHHANLSAGRKSIAKRFNPLTALELNLPTRFVMAIDTMHMENRFCYVNAGSGNLHLGLLLIL